jgi:hypothetical protein
MGAAIVTDHGLRYSMGDDYINLETCKEKDCEYVSHGLAR